MHTITLNNTRYHRQADFCDWLRKNVGQGGWNALHDIGNLWGITSMFGCTTISFIRETDRNQFELAFNIKNSDLISRS